jgi:anti-sigma regulatory factor (Ser/Thr protein kinase)
MTIGMMARSFPARASALRQVRAFVADQADRSGFDPTATADLVLAVWEACANALRHTDSRTIRVGWKRDTDHLEVSVRDEGIFRWRDSSLGLRQASGRGIPLIGALVDEVRIERGTEERPGTVVRLVKYDPAPELRSSTRRSA